MKIKRIRVAFLMQRKKF